MSLGKATAILVFPIMALFAAVPLAAEVFDVTAYGAVCDGVTDDAAAIQAAIDAAEAAGGGIVSLPTAICGVADQLNVNGVGVSIEGEGQGATVVRWLAGTYPSKHTFLISATQASIRALTIDGNRSVAGPSITGVTVLRSEDIVVEDIETKDLAGYGIYVTANTTTPNRRILLQNNHVHGGAKYGIFVLSIFDDVQIRGNSIHDNDSTAVYIRNAASDGNASRRLIFDGNTIGVVPGNHLGPFGLYFVYGELQDVVVTNNLIEGGLNMKDVGDGVFTGNRIRRDGYVSLAVGDSLGPLVFSRNLIEATSLPANQWSASVYAPLGSEVSFVDNIIRTNCNGLKISSGQRTSAVGNSITLVGTSCSTTNYGLLGHADFPIDDLLVSDNQVEQFRYGIIVGPDDADVDTVLVTDNIIRSSAASAVGVQLNWVDEPNTKGFQVFNAQESGNLVVLTQ